MHNLRRRCRVLQPAQPLPTAAAAAPLAQVAQWLIDEVKADVDARDPRLQTPLHHAGLKGHVSRRRRASNPQRSQRGDAWPPAVLLSRLTGRVPWGQATLVQLLLHRGADPMLRDAAG